MYGFIKPDQSQLSKEDKSAYKKAYCGQCATLQEIFGYHYRTLVSYDAAFFGLLISAQQNKPDKTEKQWCAIFPKKPAIYSTKQLPQIFSACIANLILSIKLSDAVLEKKSFIKNLSIKLCSSKFKKAKEILKSLQFPIYLLNDTLERQQKIETLDKQEIETYAEPSACFIAEIFRFTAVTTGNTKNEKLLYQIGYHTGKIIYLIDSCIDIIDDVEKKKFNALIASYQTDEDIKVQIENCNTNSSDFYCDKKNPAQQALLKKSQTEPVKIIIASLTSIKTLLKEVEFTKHHDLIQNILLNGFPAAIYTKINNSIATVKNQRNGQFVRSIYKRNKNITLKYLPHTALASALCLFSAQNVEAADFICKKDAPGYIAGCSLSKGANCTASHLLEICINPCFWLIPTKDIDCIIMPVLQAPKAYFSFLMLKKITPVLSDSLKEPIKKHKTIIHRTIAITSLISLAFIILLTTYNFTLKPYLAQKELKKNTTQVQSILPEKFKPDVKINKYKQAETVVDTIKPIKLLKQIKQIKKIKPAQMIQSYNAPPVIAVASPFNNKRTASDYINLIGKIVDDKEVATVKLSVNGKPAILGRTKNIVVTPRKKSKEMKFNYKILLKSGENKIQIIAYDIENLSTTETINIFKIAEKREIWAGVIGIDQYKNKNIDFLEYAKKDAKAFADYLKKNMNVSNNHIFELYNKNATKREINSLLGTKLRKKAGKEDTVFIFFAGHGAPEADSASSDGDGISKYIIPFDADPEDLYSSAIAMDQFAEIFRRIQAERIVLIMDSCYSGRSGGRTLLAGNNRAIVIRSNFLNRISEGKGRIILTSSSANEVSQESDKLRHGVFTYYLLQGLKGNADYDKDKLIDIDEIYMYLNRKVSDATGNQQHPVKKGETEGKIIIGTYK